MPSMIDSLKVQVLYPARRLSQAASRLKIVRGGTCTFPELDKRLEEFERGEADAVPWSQLKLEP